MAEFVLAYVAYQVLGVLWHSWRADGATSRERGEDFLIRMICHSCPVLWIPMKTDWFCDWWC